jgi:predicted AAA+ superfamily ATPase
VSAGRERLPSLLRSLLERIDRLAALAEPVLERLGGAKPSSELFDRFSAFRWEAAAGAGRLVPITQPQGFDLAELVGVERAVDTLVRNTRQFVRGLPANHVLLFGERGTGKSSAVRGLLTRFAGQGLRIVEVHKSDLMHLPHVLDALRGAPKRFLLFCDDLSFDEGERGHRELKACLEGSLEAPPENVRVIATSNRRHLLPQRMAENLEARLDARGEIHLGEALEEKLALADRFGLVLGFYSFDQATFLDIVERKAVRAGIALPAEQLRAEALRFALERSSRSGRTARQFVDDLAGRLALRDEDEEAAAEERPG